jgi:glycosyltransferase involved in cell wall biosynthesis
MKVAFITRSTLFNVPGGDTEQIRQTALYLKKTGIHADIRLTNESINYDSYDLLHFSNITRPSDILYHARKSKKPFVISPNLINYSEYDKYQREGFLGFVFKFFSADTNEYLKTILRWLLKKDVLRSKAYLRKGQKRSIREILKRSSLVLPNSHAEEAYLKTVYSIDKPFSIVPNGIDANLFTPDDNNTKDNKLVICAARIEGLKNQYNLIRALNFSGYALLIIGDPAPNQKKYYQKCKDIAAHNIIFTGRLSQQEIAEIYKKAKVHVLPSWFETCGLSTLEAAAMGCNIVITDRGYTREYFGNDAFYCEPSDPDSILKAVQQASQQKVKKDLQKKIFNSYTWERAAEITAEAYKKLIPD